MCSADVEAKSGQAGARRRDAPSTRSAPGPPRRAGPSLHPIPSDQMPKDPARVSRQFEHGSTVSISAVDHMMGDIKERERKKYVESFIFFLTTSTSLASLRTERVCVCVLF